MSAIPAVRQLGQWDSAEVVQDWKSSSEFKELLGRLVKLAEELEPTEHVTLMSVADGFAEAHTPPEALEAIHAPP